MHGMVNFVGHSCFSRSNKNCRHSVHSVHSEGSWHDSGVYVFSIDNFTHLSDT